MKWLTRWFDDDVDWYPPSAILLSVYFFYQAITQNRWLIEGFPRPSVLAAVCGLIFGIGCLLKMPGARWFGVPWLLLLIVAHAINSVLNGWSALNIGGMVVFLLMAAHYVWLYFFEKPALERAAAEETDEEESEEESDEENRPFLSLVLLFRESPYLDTEVLARLATNAWGIPMRSFESGEASGDERIDANRPSEMAAGGFIIGDTPPYIVKHPEAFVIVHHFDRPYFDDPAAVAEDIVERRLQRAVAEHQAWTSVDVIKWLGEGADPDVAAYRVVARLLAELADDNVLAVVDPAAEMIFAYDPETERKLRSKDPRAELREPYYAPVISVSDEDPEMIAAVEEARRRWPEFVAAFEKRTPDEKLPYTVKAPVGPEGNIEFIWIEVTGIESDIIYGNLGNEPAAIPNLKLGDRVRVPVAKLNDWMYLADGKPCGGFTLKVIANHARRGRERKSE